MKRPDAVYNGLIPTMNNRGFMADTMEHFAECFVKQAGRCRYPVLDIGCAYGIATRAALELGATVVASDMEQAHLDVLINETPLELRERLVTRAGVLPGLSFDNESFDAILCSRLLHFLLPREVGPALTDMRDWLRPGGSAYLIADTPYTGFWFSTAPEYERRKASGDEWPGFIADIGSLLKDGKIPPGMLPHMNPMDPDILSRECERVGLIVVEADFSGGKGREQGRAHAGVIAQRPA